MCQQLTFLNSVSPIPFLGVAHDSHYIGSCLRTVFSEFPGKCEVAFAMQIFNCPSHVIFLMHFSHPHYFSTLSQRKGDKEVLSNYFNFFTIKLEHFLCLRSRKWQKKKKRKTLEIHLESKLSYWAPNSNTVHTPWWSRSRQKLPIFHKNLPDLSN